MQQANIILPSSVPQQQFQRVAAPRPVGPQQMRPLMPAARQIQPRQPAMNEVQNIMEINKKLQKRVEELNLDKSKLEVQLKKEAKLHQIKLNAAEENARQLEELLTDGDPTAAKKAEESNRKVQILEQRLKTTEEASTVLNRQLNEMQVQSSAQTEKIKKLELENAKTPQLVAVIEHLEKSLAAEKNSSKNSAQIDEYKEKLAEAEEKLNNALQSALEPKQQILIMKEKIAALKNKAKEKILEKTKELEKAQTSLGQLEQKHSSLESELLACKQELLTSQSKDDEIMGLTHQLSNYEVEVSRLNEALNESSRISTNFQSQLEDKENQHFTEVLQLQNKIKNLETKNINDMSQIEDEWIRKMSEATSMQEKTEIKLKVSEDMLKQANAIKGKQQEELDWLRKAAQEAVVEKDKLTADLATKESEREELETRCSDAEKRLQETSDQIYNWDSQNSYKTRLEYQVNYLREQLHRVQNGVEVPVPDVVPEKEEAPVLDENELFLKFLDTDTSEVIRDLQNQLGEKAVVIKNLENLIKQKEDVIAALEATSNEMITLEDAADALKLVAADLVPVGVTFDLHRSKMTEMTRLLEVKESEVLWVKSEAEEKQQIVEANNRQVEKILKEEIAKLSSEKETLEASHDEDKAKMAFMQCGLEEPNVDKIKITELEKKLEDKEDHFVRELELLKEKNIRLEALTAAKSSESENHQTQLSKSNEKLREIQEKLDKLTKENEKLFVSLNNSSADVTLNESVHDLEEALKAKEKELEKEKELGSFLNQSLEIEKVEAETFRKEKDALEQEKAMLQGEVQALKENAASNGEKLAKEHKLEVETLKSELSLTKLKLKESQESSIKVHEELFIEHQDIVETIKQMSQRKRKRLFEDIYEKTKKLREDIPSQEDDSLNDSQLLETSIDTNDQETPTKKKIDFNTVEESSIAVEDVDFENIPFVMDEELPNTDVSASSVPTTVLHMSWE